MDLTNATVGRLEDSKASWPEQIRFEGLTYQQLECNPRVPVKDRLAWLARSPVGYSQQPYLALADSYRRAGRDSDARKVLINHHRLRAKGSSAPARVWSHVLRLGIGYGYKPLYALGWLVIAIAVGTVVVSRGYPSDFHQSGAGGNAPTFHAIAYSADVVLPVIDLGQAAAWTADGASQVATWLLTVSGWLLASVVLAAAAGLMRRH
jgi:hypothetical protein